jgi:hypothetical protein
MNLEFMAHQPGSDFLLQSVGVFKVGSEAIGLA